MSTMSGLTSIHDQVANTNQTASLRPTAPPSGDSQLDELFEDFVGETFFGQFMSAMRKTVNKPAYFHGGRAEEVFQGQLDQILSQHMTEASAKSFSDPMLELFMLNRQ